MTPPEARLSWWRPGLDLPLGGGPRPDRSLVLQLAERLHLPEALAALLVQRGQSDPRARAATSVPPSAISPIRSSSPAWRKRWTPSPPRSAAVAPSWCTATTTWTASAPPRCSPARSTPPERTSCPSFPTASATATTSAPPASTRPAPPGPRWSSPATAASPRWTPCAKRAPPGSAWSSPITTSRATRCRPRSRWWTRSDRTTSPGSRGSAAPGSRSSWSRRWCRRSISRSICPTTCSTWWRSPPWPTWCRSRARTGSW